MKKFSQHLALVLLLIGAIPASAAGPKDKEKAEIIGQPTALVVQPPSITLEWSPGHAAARGHRQVRRWLGA